jgi:hypothetical protein
MKDFLERRPPFAGRGRFNGLLARVGEHPPFPRLRVGGHHGHIGPEIIPVILEIAKKQTIAKKDRVIVDMAIPNHPQDLGPDGPVELFILFELLGFELNDLSVAFHGRSSSILKNSTKGDGTESRF